MSKFKIIMRKRGNKKMENQNVFFCDSKNQKNLKEYLFKKVYKDKKIKTFFIEGKNCINKGALFEEFSRVLSFPGYFGRNWDAFDECINDLRWLQEKEIVVIIINSDQLLDLASEEKNKLIFWDIIKATVCAAPREKYSNMLDANEPRSIFVLQSSNPVFLNNILQLMAV